MRGLWPSGPALPAPAPPGAAAVKVRLVRQGRLAGLEAFGCFRGCRLCGSPGPRSGVRFVRLPRGGFDGAEPPPRGRPVERDGPDSTLRSPTRRLATPAVVN